MRIVGLDLSLSCTGVAVFEDGQIVTSVIKTSSKVNRYSRLVLIRDAIHAVIAGADLVVLEDQPTHTRTPVTVKFLGELHGVVGVMLHTNSFRVARVNVSTLKRYALGKGVGKKGEIALAAYKYFGVEFAHDDEYDAYYLCLMGMEHAGLPVLTARGTPLPQTHRAAIDKVEWPLLVKDG